MKPKNAQRYFAYLAKAFPVLCGTELYPHFPLTSLATGQLGKIADLSPRGLEKSRARVEGFRDEFRKLSAKAAGDQSRRQAEALAQHADALVVTFYEQRKWINDPLLYLTIAFTGLKQAMDASAGSNWSHRRRLHKRLKAIPAILDRGLDNLDIVTREGKGAAQAATRGCARLLAVIAERFENSRTIQLINDCNAALRKFDRGIANIGEAQSVGAPSMNVRLRRILGVEEHSATLKLMLEEEFQLAREEVVRTDGWRTLHGRWNGPDLDRPVTEIYSGIAAKLRTHFAQQILKSAAPGNPTECGPLPAHLHYIPQQALLSTVPEKTDESFLLVNTQVYEDWKARDDHEPLHALGRNLIHSAIRETWPGRHFLRIVQQDLLLAPLRNGLFFNGWIAYCEWQLGETGFFSETLANPVADLDNRVRRFRKAALARVDLGLSSGELDQDAAVSLLTDAAISHEDALKEIRNILTTPGKSLASPLGLIGFRNLHQDGGDFIATATSMGEVPLRLLG